MLAQHYDTKRRASAQEANIRRKPEKLDKAFGGRMKDAMRRERIGTKALAIEAGVHPVTVSGWRRGRRPTVEAQFVWLANRLKAPLKWLKSAEGQMTDASPTSGASIPQGPERAPSAAESSAPEALAWAQQAQIAIGQVVRLIRGSTEARPVEPAPADDAEKIQRTAKRAGRVQGQQPAGVRKGKGAA